LPGLLLLSGGSACGGEPCGPSKAVVAKVIDGDTVELENGEKVRYLLVNTQEITHGKNECFGSEAAKFNSDLVLGKEIKLKYPEACRDRFSRYLAYVEVDGLDVNALLVERGYACTYFVAPSGAERLSEFDKLELDARAAKRGLWGSCQEILCQD